MRFTALLAAWTANEFAILLGAIAAFVTTIGAAVRGYLVYRDKSVRDGKLLIQRSMAETDLTRVILETAVDNQNQLHIAREVTGAHRVLVFRTHNGDGIPKPTQQVKSTATLESFKPEFDPILSDWTAEVAEPAFLEALIAATDRKGESILVVSEKLPDGPLKDRLIEGRTPFVRIAYVTEVEHFPAYLIAFYSSLAKANSATCRTAIQRVANRFRANQLKVAERLSRVASLDNQVAKSIEKAA